MHILILIIGGEMINYKLFVVQAALGVHLGLFECLAVIYGYMPIYL